MISVLVPSRGRPDGMRRLVESGRATASVPPEFVFYLDDDDPASRQAADELGVTVVGGPRIVLSQMWNRCWDEATADVAMHCGDDIVFRTPGWDAAVLEAFAQVPDRIALVYGRDGVHDQALSTHGFLHRRWVEALGYFVPPHFSSDYNDLWLYEVAGQVGRRVFLPHVYTEHMHPAVGKGELDQTHRERLARHSADQVDQLWHRLAPERAADAAKLQAAIDTHREG